MTPRQERYQKRREEELRKMREYNLAHKNSISVWYSTYRHENREKIDRRVNKWHTEHKDRVREIKQHWAENNKDKIQQAYINFKPKRNLKKRIKLKTDTRYRFETTLRQRLRQAIKSSLGVKAYKTQELLGCSIQDLRRYLESQFQCGMTWDNYGYYGWHVDHIRPCAAFDLSDPEQQKQCFHYSNLQPLWWKDNLLKSDKAA